MTDLNSTIASITTDLLAIDQGENPDMKIEFEGYHHGRGGFRLVANNIECHTDRLITDWKKMVNSYGYQCEISSDFTHGWIVLKCAEKKSISKMPLKSPVYLSILCLCIYLLWMRHSTPYLE
jgi:hypothetical protein